MNDGRSSHFYFLKYDEINTIRNINIWVKYFKYFSKVLLGHRDKVARDRKQNDMRIRL